MDRRGRTTLTSTNAGADFSSEEKGTAAPVPAGDAARPHTVTDHEG
jgi:hypothetical protein